MAKATEIGLAAGRGRCRCVFFHQHGLGLLAFLALIGVIALLFGVGKFIEARRAAQAREDETAYVLQRAREALLGYAARHGGALPLPDLDPSIDAKAEGDEPGNFSGNQLNYAVLGRLPWRSLGLGDLRDAQNECLWYVVAGRFKDDSLTRDQPLDWDHWQHDSGGGLVLSDANGNPLPGRYAAFVIAAGKSLPNQNRASVPGAPRCLGNYDARNYLDPWNSADAPLGRPNYLAGADHHLSSDAADQFFHLRQNDVNNDHIVGIKPDDKFFSDLIRANLPGLMDVTDVGWMNHLKGNVGSVNKGFDNINCNNAPTGYQDFCRKWKDHFLLTQIDPPAPIVIDGNPTTSNCAYLLIFGGKAETGEARDSAAARNLPANYLDAANEVAFAVPKANSSNFAGWGQYDPLNPSRDVILCIP